MIVAHRCSRRGYTLFEMVLVIASASVMFALCGGLLHLLLRLDRAGRTHISDASAMARLARQFRDDVHDAEKAEPGVSDAAKTAMLSLSSPGGSAIQYKADGDRLLRLEFAGDKLLRREAYSMKRHGPAAFESDGAFVRLVLPHRPGETGGPIRRAVRIEARLGKHRDLARLTEARK